MNEPVGETPYVWFRRRIRFDTEVKSSPKWPINLSKSSYFQNLKSWNSDVYPGFCCIKRLGVFLLPLDGMLVHHSPFPHNLLGFPKQLAGTHLYSWVKRGTVRVKCVAQEHNTVSPARARTRTARSGDERTNHEATAPPTMFIITFILCSKLLSSK